VGLNRINRFMIIVDIVNFKIKIAQGVCHDFRFVLNSSARGGNTKLKYIT
jgi:hypothetical protein